MTSKQNNDSRLTLAESSVSYNASDIKTTRTFRIKSLWKNRTPVEKALLGIILGLLLVTLGLVIGVGVLGTQALAVFAAKHARTLCESPGCIEAASTILHNMDPTKDPCVDFYQFACGGFQDKIIMADSRSNIDAFDSIEEELQARLRFEINQHTDPHEPQFIRVVKDFYNSCMNESIVEHYGVDPLRVLLNRVGGWPVLLGDLWSEVNFDWQKTVFQFREMGVYMSFLIDISVVRDLKDSSRFILQIDQPNLGMPDRSYFLEGLSNPMMNAYFDLMVNVAGRMGVDRKVAREELLQSLQFEIELAKISLPVEEQRNFTKLYNKMNVSDLYLLAPQMNWTYYFNNLLPVEIDMNEEIIVISPEYVRKFAEMMEKTPKRMVANYLMWRTIMSLMDFTSSHLRVLQMDYTRILTGQQQQVTRWRYCMDITSSYLEIPVGALYVRKLFRTESKMEVLEIVHEVRREFYEVLEKLDWLDEKTRKKALEKATAMTEYIAYPDELLDDDILDKAFSKLFIDKYGYFDNILRLNKFITDYYLSRLRKKASQFKWIEVGAAAVVNAFYKFSDNSMQFHAGILNGAFFHYDRPYYLNFGSLGFIVAHEISHGFDDMGRQYDKEGNLQNWWDEETDRKFKEKSACIIEQFGNFTLPEIGMKVNGIHTQGENIADVGGLKYAYRAYKKWEAKFGPEPLLPGMNFSTNQLFWIGMANVFCSKSRPEWMKLDVVTNPHSPHRFRVNGPMSNLVEFAEDFQCPIGSPMNPQHKCSVW